MNIIRHFSLKGMQFPKQTSTVNTRHHNLIPTGTMITHSNMPEKIPGQEFSHSNFNGINEHANTLYGAGKFKELIDILCNERRFKDAVDTLVFLEQRGLGLDSHTYERLLRDCIQERALAEVKRVRVFMNKYGFKPGVFLGNRLIDLYVKLGNLCDARQVFDKMLIRDVSSWNTLITGYVKWGSFEEAGDLFEAMPKRDIVSWNVMTTGLVNCGRLEDARRLFDKIPERDEFTWNSMISAYARHGYSHEAMDMFCAMRRAGMKLSNFTFAGVLSACATERALDQGKWLHGLSFVAGFESNIFVSSALIDMYAKCGRLNNARSVFDRMIERDCVSWNAMITGYACHGHGVEVLQLFWQMKCAGVKPTEFTFVSLLGGCGSLAAVEQGKQIHTHVIRTGFGLNVFVQSALVDMYAECGKIDDARQLFDKMTERDQVSWNGMISGYARHGFCDAAMKLFWEMQAAGVSLDEFTFTSILGACAVLPALEHSKKIHGHIIKMGFESTIFVGNRLIHMYAKKGSMEEAKSVFARMPQVDEVSWNALIGGYVQDRQSEESLKLFSQMAQAGKKPNEFTFANVLSACACLVSLTLGTQIHGNIIQIGFELNIYAGSALVDMYGKCGNLDNARQVFDMMPERDLVSWTAMISGYAQNGQGRGAIQLFEQMLLTGTKPDQVTFISVLSACSHAGLVDEGCHYFYSMSKDHCMIPKVDHFACMIDLLGRAGRLGEAGDLINKLPFEPDATIWGALLSACRVHGNLQLGKLAAEFLIKLEPQNAATYVLLSNLYAAAGRWDDVARVRKMMKDMGVKKKPGCSWIEVKNKAHAFVVGDRSHPQIKEIYALLEELLMQMKVAGYVPNINLMLLDAD